MNIKLKIITTLLGVFFGCGIVTSQTPKAEQAMDSKRQHITEVAALTGKGDLDKLKIVLIDGLNDGMAVSELKEVMVHAYAYCGFPRALRGLQTLVAVLDDRKAKGIEDDWGRKASPITDTRSKYERGRDILVEISGIPADAPKADYAILAPEIEVFLKEHLFADLFERAAIRPTGTDDRCRNRLAGQRRGTDAERAHGYCTERRHNTRRITQCVGYCRKEHRTRRS